MCAGMLAARFSRRWCSAWSAGCRLEVDDLPGDGDGELGQEVPLAAAQGGELLECSCGAGEGAGVEAVELAAGAGPGDAGGGLGDADEQEGEPAEDDMGADALLEPVIDRPQVNDLLHV